MGWGVVLVCVLSVCVCVSVCVHACLHVSVCICACICMCACVCVCMQACLRVDVRQRSRKTYLDSLLLELTLLEGEHVQQAVCGHVQRVPGQVVQTAHRQQARLLPLRCQRQGSQHGRVQAVPQCTCTILQQGPVLASVRKHLQSQTNVVSRLKFVFF